MSQRFYANPQTRRVAPNGAISYGPGDSFDCVGPWAKVSNCPIDETDLRLTCYATGYADTFFSIPACTRYRGQYVSGFFTNGDEGPQFCPYMRYWSHLGIGRTHDADIGLSLTLKTADYLNASAPGQDAGTAVRELGSEYYVREQLNAFKPDTLRAYLREFGAWSDDELASHYENQHRFVWLAACAMREGN